MDHQVKGQPATPKTKCRRLFLCYDLDDQSLKFVSSVNGVYLGVTSLYRITPSQVVFENEQRLQEVRDDIAKCPQALCIEFTIDVGATQIGEYIHTTYKVQAVDYVQSADLRWIQLLLEAVLASNTSYPAVHEELHILFLKHWEMRRRKTEFAALLKEDQNVG